MIVDVLIFGGQSNMQGTTRAFPETNPIVENAYEYRFLTDRLVPLQHPCGETIENDLLLQSDGGGTMVPDCCRVYTEKTGHTVVAIHAARGATMLKEWLKGTDRYECARKKFAQGIAHAKKLGTLGKIYYLWLQGESDAYYRTTEEEYIHMLTQYKNDLKQDVGIDKFGIIEIGYFNCMVDWLKHEPYEEMKACDETIMRAHENAPKHDPDFVLLTQICKELSLDKQYITVGADGHYNNKGQAIIGKEAGKALAEL